MEKRVEKVVEWIKDNKNGKKEKVFAETEHYYSLMDNNGDLYSCLKHHLKVVSEKEVLEFECELFHNSGDYYNIRMWSEIDLTNYDLKLIATPKEKDIEYWKNNAEDGYEKTPICVLRYITELEELLKEKE